MFKALLRTRFAAFGAWIFRTSSAKKSNSKLKLISLGALMLYACFAFMMMFGIYFQQIAKPFFQAGIGWLYFTFFAMTAFALMFIGSVFVVKTQLYEARDNDLLLSMPIPPKYILASRMLMIMLLNFLFELLVAAPAVYMWVSTVQVSALQVLCFAAIFLALPFLSVAVSGLFGWLLAISTSRLRNKSMITVLFSIIFLLLYFYFFSQANLYIQKLILNGTAIAGSLGSVSPLFWVGNSVAEPNALQLVYSLAIMILPFLLMYHVMSATFIRVATAKRGSAKIVYEEKAMQTSSASKALFNRELKHLLSSPGYLLNAGLGVIFSAIGAVVVVVKKATILKLITQIGYDKGTISVFIILGLCLLATTVLFTAPSVSLEGKTIWIVKSLPVSTKDVLRAKLRLHIYLTAPATLLASAAAIYVFTPSFINAVLILTAPVLFVAISANIGLICNLKNPNLDWVNETQVVKQSISVLMAMLFSAAVVLIPGALFLAVLSNIESALLPFAVGYTLLLALGWYLTQRWIYSKGTEIFDGLG